MQPFRRDDSFWLDDPIVAISPRPLSPLNLPYFADGPFARDALVRSPIFENSNDPVRPIPLGSPGSHGRLIGGMQPSPFSDPSIPAFFGSPLVRKALATSETFNANAPVQPGSADDTPFSTGNLLGRIQPDPFSTPNMPAFMGSQFVRDALARSKTFADANRSVQPVYPDDVALSIGDLTSSIRPAPLSAPNMPSVMDDPRVRAARARLVTSPAANGHVQPVRADDAQLPIGDPRRSIADYYAQEAREQRIGSDTDDSLDNMSSTGDGSEVRSKPPSSIEHNIYAGLHYFPVIGGFLDAYDDYEKGDYAWALADAALGLSDVTLTSALTRGALKGGMRVLGKKGSKDWKDVRALLGELWNLPPGIPVHHAFISRTNKYIPAGIRNHHLNLRPMYKDTVGGRTSQQLHNAVHGWRGKGPKDNRFDPNDFVNDYFLRIKYGWPEWAHQGIPAAAASTALNYARALNKHGDD